MDVERSMVARKLREEIANLIAVSVVTVDLKLVLKIILLNL
jgi:hypothetical protein